jgi:hypothetical protein
MKIILCILLAVFTLSSCEKFLPEIYPLTGTGAIQTEERLTPSFSKIDNRIGADINIIKSTSRHINVFAQGNLLPFIHTKVINDALIITSYDRTLITDQSITIDVYVPSIQEVKISGAGQVKSDCPLSRIYLSGSGNITCSGKSDNVEIILSGYGNIDLLDMEVGSADIHISGSGNVKMNVSDWMDVNIQGTGNVFYKGNPKISEHISGVGSVIYIG